MTDNKNMTENDINKLASTIVNKMMRLKTMEAWFDHVRDTELANTSDYEDLQISKEDEALGEAAKLMTLMNLFQEREEYEKCAIVKRRLDAVNKILKNL